MRFWLVKFTGLVVSLAFFLTLIAPTGMALAQEGDCTDPDYYREHIQACSGFTPQSILQAVQAPTPNLANTTAYVFYTLLVLLTGSMDPGSLNVASAQPGDNYYADQRLDRPDSLGEALGNGGAIGGVAYAMSELITTRPASLGDYTYYLAKNSRFTPQPAYAQGFGVGFGALYPVLPIWAAFRDIAYFLLTLMFFITGLLIIFRKKVSGNVAVTVQNALPRLVLTLIFITFSYPIAGFIVDLMFWAIYFIIFIFAGMFTEAPFTTTLPSSLFEERNIFSLFADTSLFKIAFVFIMGSGARSAAEAMEVVIFDAISSVPILGDIASIGFVESIIGGVMKLIFTLIIGVAILIQIFRTFFQLLMSYAGFIINVVLSPFVLLQGAVPGKDPLVNWLKNLVAGLAPFVVVVFMLMMSFILVGINTRPGIGYGSDQGDMETGSGLRLPLIGGQDISQQAIMGLLGLGFIMLLPEAVKMTKDLIGVKGGPLDQYKDKAMENLKTGWTGGEMLPGLGVTKIPGAQRFTLGSAESRKREQGKDVAQRTIPSRLYNLGAIGGTMGIGSTFIKAVAARKGQEAEGLKKSDERTPVEAQAAFRDIRQNQQEINRQIAMGARGVGTRSSSGSSSTNNPPPKASRYVSKKD